MKNENYKKLFLAFAFLTVLFFGYILGNSNARIVPEAIAEPKVMPSPAPYLYCEKVYQYGKGYIVFSTNSGGLFVIKE